MRLIIDIPDEDYTIIKMHDFTWCYCVDNLFEAVKNGKPLDISADEATKQFKKNLENKFYIDHATSPFKGTTTDIDYGG